MKLESPNQRAPSKLSGRQVSGRCLCGAVELETDFPAFWAWHDHSAANVASPLAHRALGRFSKRMNGRLTDQPELTRRMERQTG